MTRKSIVSYSICHVFLSNFEKSIKELRHARDAFESELAISHRVKKSTLEEINLGFNTWLSLIAVIPKKNGQIRVCVDYRKLNAATVTDAFPLLFMCLRMGYSTRW